ncbi:MAG: glycosyltransferase [Bdellovibrionales bacterium]|nr:glycosyltransferase [Bdellovibrionales bacterium]
MEFDVIHLHGSGVTPFSTHAIRVHTLHGTTFGRMAACREWLWPGGYAAELREVRGVLESNVVLSVRPGLSLFEIAKRLGKTVEVCWNGWDAGNEMGELSKSVKARLSGGGARWIFVGRGDDSMKGADRIRGALGLKPGVDLIAAPGLGFEGREDVLATGRLDSSQVRSLMAGADGLLIPSRYEGHSLVLLEALSEGLVVLATRVGGVPYLPSVRGLEILESGDARELRETMDRIQSGDAFADSRKIERRQENRKLLPKWRNVAEIALGAVERYKRKR